jgi:hypothetical protein
MDLLSYNNKVIHCCIDEQNNENDNEDIVDRLKMLDLK